MPSNDMSVGRDLTFTIVTPAGTLNISGVTDYSVAKKNTTLTSKRLNGRQVHGTIPDGFDITIRLDRRDNVLDNFFADQDAAYYAGINLRGGTIYETIQEKDGSISQYRYTDVILEFNGPGDWKGDSFIPLTLMAHATERQRV